MWSIGILNIELKILNSNSLKDKRMVLRSLKDRLRTRFNLSLAEVDNQDKWQRANLAIAHIGSDKRVVNSTMSKIISFIEELEEVEVIDFEMEML